MPGNTKSRILIGGALHEPCTICGEPGPQVQSFYIGGHVVRTHAALLRGVEAGAGDTVD
jgi:ribosomal protein S14